ncbi:MAG TPA: hypothetical protein VF980_08545 [Thermoanaerobaculia bacterium]
MIILRPGEIADLEPAVIASARECVIATADGAVGGRAAAVILLSDYAVATPRSVITIDSAQAWAGVVWRVGADALRLHASGATHFNATQASEAGLIDAIAADLDEWRASFLENRSAMALDSAAALIARRGGDALERAEFARLFAAGEPQRGLSAFLEKRRPRF